MQASVIQQKLLLKLAATDTKINGLKRELANPNHTKKAEQLQVQLQSLRTAQLEVLREEEALGAQQKRIEHDLQIATLRKTNNESKLNTVSDAKLAQNLSSEIAQLAARIDKLETTELELLETKDAVTKKLQNAIAATDAVQMEINALQEEWAIFAEQIRNQIQELATERENQAAEIVGELLSEYEEIRSRTGLGAASLKNGVSGASNMQLSPGELAEIKKTPAEQVIYCPLTGVILVRED